MADSSWAMRDLRYRSNEAGEVVAALSSPPTSTADFFPQQVTVDPGLQVTSNPC